MTNRTTGSPRGRFEDLGVLLFIAATLAAAFLIFIVQPMVGKRIVPWFGGAPGVWAVCLAFYQTTLFVGYAYAHVLIRFATPSLQAGIHGLMVVFAFLALPILPTEDALGAVAADPTSDILRILISNVALPFLILASTGPLVGAWFARLYPTRSPYPLYAVSNAGSLLAVVAYPFFIEPEMSLTATGSIWSLAFAVTGAALVTCGALTWRRAKPTDNATNEAKPEEQSEAIRAGTVTMWLLLAACAVIVMMGVSNTVTLDIASVPFLWILPLGTYLLTFILCFATERVYKPAPYLFLAVIAYLMTLGLHYAMPLLPESLAAAIHKAPIQIAAYCAMLFGIGMLMHGELYRMRPAASQLTAFYLCVSGGGALGGLFVGLLAPRLFDDYYELPFGLGLAALLVFATRLRENPWYPNMGADAWPRGAASVIALALACVAIWPPTSADDGTIRQERGFYGVLRVGEFEGGGVVERALSNGNTLHGIQTIKPGPSLTPRFYYGWGTGIGLALSEKIVEEEPLRIGVVGLGIGALSGFGREGDYFRYYEIDPNVVAVAQDRSLFTFLADSPAEEDVIVGDARISVSREQAEGVRQDFDFFIIDAFSSDAVPVHLLTVEAFRHWADAVAPGGVVAVHLSNRFFDLPPAVERVGRELGFETVEVRTASAPRFGSIKARWVMMSRDPRAVGSR